LASACTDATMLVFVLPHQFLGRICPQMTTMAKGCRCISLIKGLEFQESGPLLISDMIKEAMNGMDVSVLMGANVANEVARDDFCESTVGFKDKNNGAVWQRLLDYPTFRIGLKETIKFAKMFFSGVLDDTFLESCGLADLVTTCFGGRNRKCAEAFAKKEGSWEDLEKSMLNGQKLQGTITSKDVNVVLKSKNLASEFPLFTKIYEIAFEGKDPATITDL